LLWVRGYIDVFPRSIICCALDRGLHNWPQGWGDSGRAFTQETPQL